VYKMSPYFQIHTNFLLINKTFFRVLSFGQKLPVSVPLLFDH